MDFIILDLGSGVNILTRKTQESVGKIKLVWSHVQLKLDNHLKVLLIGQPPWVPIEVERICTYGDFEVIEIFDDTNPYPSLLGIN